MRPAARGDRRATAIVLAAGAAAALVAAASAQPIMPDSRLVAEVVATGLGEGQLQCSTAFCFVDRDTILAVSRVDGAVRRIDLIPGQVVTPGAIVLDLEIVIATPTDDQSEWGVQAIEPHPTFTSTGWVYLRYDQTKFPGRDTLQAEFNPFMDPGPNVIERYLWDPLADDGNGALTLDATIRSRLMFNQYHHGGPIVFDPAPPHHLFTSYGDQRFGDLLALNRVPGFLVGDAGTIVRLADDGSIPETNPFGVVNGAPPGTEAWYAYGSRNAFGLTIDPVTRDLWITDNGEAIYDEINRVPIAANLGWSRIMGPTDHARQPDTIALINNLPGSPAATYHNPEFSWFQTCGVTGIVFLHGSRLGPAWDDAVVVGNFNTGFVWIFRLNADRTAFALQHPGLQDRVDDRSSFTTNPVGTEAAELLWGRNFSPLFRGVIAIERGPDGLPYFLTAAGQILRVRRACPADYNGDHAVDPDDLGDFINCYFASPPCSAADWNGDGNIDPDDLGDFIDTYFAGC